MVFWQIVIALSILAGLIIVWPLVQLPFLHKSWAKQGDRDTTQVELYHEHLGDLDKALSAGDISEAEHAELKVELQKTLVSDQVQTGGTTLLNTGKKVVLAAAIFAPLLGIFFYSQVGAKPDWEIYQNLQTLAEIKDKKTYEEELRAVALKTQVRLKKTPDNHALRNLLAQTSVALQDYDQAVASYRAILEAFPESPQVMASLSQALFHRAGNTITPEVREYTKKTLALAPMLPEMLGLAGIDAKDQGDFRGAIKYWSQAVSQLDPRSQAAKGYQNGIRKAELALIAMGESVDAPAADKASKKQGASVSLKVALAEGVVLDDDATVFIYARAWKGPKVPLAIQKMTVKDLPADIVLDESMSMAPGMTMDKFESLELVARVSLSGSPAAKSGDWQALAGPVELKKVKRPITLTISDRVP